MSMTATCSKCGAVYIKVDGHNNCRGYRIDDAQSRDEEIIRLLNTIIDKLTRIQGVLSSIHKQIQGK